MQSRTRSGRIFSPATKIIHCGVSFDYERLLRDSIANEDADNADDIDAVHACSSLDAIRAANNADDIDAVHTRSGVDAIHAAATLDAAHETPSALPSPTSAHSAAQSSFASPEKRRATPTELGNNRRKRRREERQAKEDLHAPSAASQAYIRSASVMSTEMDTSGLPVLEGAYGAKPGRASNARTAYRKDDLVNLHGFTPINWNGVEPMIVADSKNRAIVAFVGRPDDPEYLKSCDSLHNAMEDMGSAVGLSGRVKPHPRGHFPALNVGILHGKGTKEPINLNNKKHTPLVNSLLGRSDLNRLARFADRSFAGFAPRMHDHYKMHLDALFDERPELRRIFPAHTSVFPTAAFNFGPNAWTYKHRDVTNCPFGWCSIQALGHFDPTKGGHLVLWELKLVVEFPPGALVLIPSAIITHSNIPVAPGDKRMSFTQYAPGGLFRYVDYGFRTEKELEKQNPQLYNDILQLRSTRWKMGLGLLATVEELQKSAVEEPQKK